MLYSLPQDRVALLGKMRSDQELSKDLSDLSSVLLGHLAPRSVPRWEEKEIRLDIEDA